MIFVAAANSDEFSDHLEELKKYCFGTDIDCARLAISFTSYMMQ